MDSNNWQTEAKRVNPERNRYKLDETVMPRVRIGEMLCDGRYKVLDYLGEGAMGIVYLCTDTVSQLEVAIKMLPPDLSDNKDILADILYNFQIVQGLKHPGIASLKTLEPDKKRNNTYLLVMEYVKGRSLQELILERKRSNTPFTLEETIKIIGQIASALDYAHSHKIVHRDIKPGNIMVSDNLEVTLLDFGLAAKIRSSLASMSVMVDNTSGTPAYKSPEQWKARPAKAAIDQYALGVIAYEMLAGYLPFEAENNDILRQAVLNEDPEPIEGLPENAWQAVAKALAKTPQERFENCMAFVEALKGDPQPAVSGKTEPEKTASSPQPQEGGSGKWVAGFLIIAILFCAGYHIFKEQPKEPRTSPIKDEPIEKERFFSGTVDCNGVVLEMVKIKAGTFTMGSPEGEKGRDDDEKQHQVTLTKDYWLGKFEVTQAQWQAVMGNNPSFFKGDNRPVEKVSWNDAKEFCSKLNEKYAGKLPAGYKFDLPTEAQWEYACRAGTTTALNNGTNLTSENGSCSNLDEIGWYDKNSNSQTHPVGQKRPNNWGLYDMHGNVWEWCRDWKDSYSGDATDPVGPSSGSYRVSRGGSWYDYARYGRSAYRSSRSPGVRYRNLGFRLALVPVQ